jgi:hypothetical protein
MVLGGKGRLRWDWIEIAYFIPILADAANFGVGVFFGIGIPEADIHENYFMQAELPRLFQSIMTFVLEFYHKTT